MSQAALVVNGSAQEKGESMHCKGGRCVNLTCLD